MSEALYQKLGVAVNRLALDLLTRQEGERIPSIREYAALVEVNANTVVRSYEWLQQQEIIFNKRGIGYYVSPEGKYRIKEMRRKRFFCDELPVFFNRLSTLGISMAEIDKHYADYLTQQSNK